MRGVLICVWLLIPAAVAAYHYGPGQEKMLLDDVDNYLREAKARVSAGDWNGAIKSYESALVLLPADRINEAGRVRVERDNARLRAGKLPEAYDDLTYLVQELSDNPKVSPELMRDARRALAGAQYYLTWLMRLEGQPRQIWEPEIEEARQNYRLLAEQAEASGDERESQRSREDLEAAIRLARMDLSELQALPLPGQCKGCNSGQCNCKGKGKNPKKSDKKSQDARGASSGPPPDGRGS